MRVRSTGRALDDDGDDNVVGGESGGFLLPEKGTLMVVSSTKAGCSTIRREDSARRRPVFDDRSLSETGIHDDSGGKTSCLVATDGRVFELEATCSAAGFKKRESKGSARSLWNDSWRGCRPAASTAHLWLLLAVVVAASSLG